MDTPDNQFKSVLVVVHIFCGIYTSSKLLGKQDKDMRQTMLHLDVWIVKPTMPTP